MGDLKDSGVLVGMAGRCAQGEYPFEQLHLPLIVSDYLHGNWLSQELPFQEKGSGRYTSPKPGLRFATAIF